MRRIALALLMAFPLAAANYYVTIAGLGGEAEYEERFTTWARQLDQVFHDSGTDAVVHTLHGAQATRERIRDLFREIAADAAASDSLALMLIGHGSYDGYEYKMNLPGPDITAAALASLLDRVPAARQLVVVMTSASGGALPELQKRGRTVITATKSGTERNAVMFPRYWVAALEDAAADTDKNEVITALEAFRYAARKTAEFYTTQKRLATEHAVLEDTGGGEGVRSPSPENGRGLEAGRFPLLRIGQAQRAALDPAKRKLLARKESLEQQIDRLKYEKAAMPLEEYRQRLTELLLELARTQQELER